MKVMLTSLVDIETYQKLDLLAEKYNTSKSEIVRICLKEGLKELEKKE